MNERQEGLGKLVVARGNASELLDAAEEAFDQVAIAIQMPIERARIASIGSRRNHGLPALRADRGDEGIRVLALVGDDGAAGKPLDQRRGLIDIGKLARRQDDPQRVAQGIDRHMQLGAQPAARAADRLCAVFFLAPALCW